MHALLSRSLALSISLIASASVASAGTLFVDANLLSGANDGSSWADAFQGELGLQAALSVATSGDEVFVADGKYLPTNTTARNLSFNLINGVTIYGGFFGGEATPAERPPFGTAPSILSGDLAGNDNAQVFSDNSFHIIRTAGTNATAVLDGFDVVSGNANSSGGNNDRGGGILCTGNVKPLIFNTRFINNRSSFGGAAGYCNGGAAPTFVDCSFIGGIGGSFGGAFDLAGAGPVRYERCLFAGNTAARAGALEIFSTNGVIVSNCVFRDNTATGTGGGGGIWVGSGGNTQFRNITVVGNQSINQTNGGMRNQGADATTVVNSIFWDNSGPGGAQNPSNQITVSTNVTYSIVEGGLAGTGNLAANPGFANQAINDFRLGNKSAAIDAGNSAAIPNLSVADIAGNVRTFDSPYVADTGVGGAPIVDMGAYEWVAGVFSTASGCVSNPATLTPITASANVGQTFQLALTTNILVNAVGVCYAGGIGLDANGCGVVVPGVGEVLLNPAVQVIPLGAAFTVSGVGSFTLNVPPTPASVGKVIHLQAVVSTSTPIPNPIELTNLISGIIEP